MTVRDTIVAQQWASRILVAVDDSENASRAANVAVTLAKKFGAELLICHAIPMPSSSFGTIDTKSIYFDAARKNAKRFYMKTSNSLKLKASKLLSC